MTADDLLELPDGERHLELLMGRVRERHKGMSASLASGAVVTALQQYAECRGAWVFGWGLGYCCFPSGDVRRVSATYLRREQMPADLVEADVSFLPVFPDLAADSRAVGAADAEIEADAVAWLTAGSAEFWDIDTAGRTVRVFRPGGVVTCLGPADTLTTPLLPGFAVPVAALFRRPTAAGGTP